MSIRSMRTKSWALVATLSIGMGLGCQESAPPEPESPGIEAVVSTFEPPADGKLTDEQVRMYVAAAKQAPDPDTPPPAPPEDGALLAALERQSQGHVEAARRLGYDPDEYQWIRARIMEAQLPGDTQLDGLAAAVNAAALEGLEKQRKDAADPEEEARLAEQIAALEARSDDSDTSASEGILPAETTCSLITSPGVEMTLYCMMSA